MAHRLLLATASTFFLASFMGPSDTFASSLGASLEGLQDNEDRRLQKNVRNQSVEPQTQKAKKPRKPHQKKAAPSGGILHQYVEQSTPVGILPVDPIVTPGNKPPLPLHQPKEIQIDLEKTSLNQNLLPPQENKKKNKRNRKKKNPEFITSPQQIHQHGKNKMDFTDQIALGQQSAIRLPKAPIEETIPIVESLIQTVIQNKIEIPVKVHVLLNREELLNFHKVFTSLVSNYPFPFTWSTTNKGFSSLEDESSPYILELSLASQAKTREKVEKEFVYQVSPEEEKNVNWPFVFDVAMKSGFTLEDFKFNNSIKIRLIELKGSSEQEDLETLQQFLEQRLAKDNNPFHILGVTFNSKTKGHHGEMFNVFLRKISEVNVGYRSRGMVFDSQNGVLYLCLDNMHRKMLDLHGGRSEKKANQETHDFIMQAYEAFKEDVTVLTGRGNHVNSNGTRGVLKDAFETWMEAEPFSSIVKQYFSLGGEGGYKVIFKKLQNLNLNNLKSEDSVMFIKKTFAQMVQEKKTRLHITLNSEESPPAHNQEFHLMMAVYADLHANDTPLVKFISPISFESTPGEMKIIFNTQHSKSPHAFTFMNSYGSMSVFGTIH